MFSNGAEKHYNNKNVYLLRMLKGFRSGSKKRLHGTLFQDRNFYPDCHLSLKWNLMLGDRDFDQVFTLYFFQDRDCNLEGVYLLNIYWVAMYSFTFQIIVSNGF